MKTFNEFLSESVKDLIAADKKERGYWIVDHNNIVVEGPYTDKKMAKENCNEGDAEKVIYGEHKKKEQL